MTTSGESRLTKFSNGITILTSNFANSLFGGLYGSAEGSLLDPSDIRVSGHKHDGVHLDGHVSKIDLVNHVDGKLTHINLEDEAVYKNNVGSFSVRSNAIPEYEVIEGTTYYKLDLSSVYDAISTLEEEIKIFEVYTDGYIPNGVIKAVDTDYSDGGLSFVIGSSQLDDLNSGTNGDKRFFFEKSTGAFRAGQVTSNAWDSASRGANSAAFGLNNKAISEGSFVSGEDNAISSPSKNSAAFGYNNGIDSENSFAVGSNNKITTSAENSSVFGTGNDCRTKGSAIFGKEARANSIEYETVFAGGKFSEVGDAQYTTYCVKLYQPAGSAYPPRPLTSESLVSYQAAQFCSYIVNAYVIGRQRVTGQTAAFQLSYIVEKGMSASPAVSYAAYKIILWQGPALLGTDASIDVVSDKIRILVSDSLPSANHVRWFANVNITKIKHA
jgi:hypothetical protein